MSTERLMQIGELAERTGVSLPTLRHYDEAGLLSPSGRSGGGFRLYSEADYEQLMVIRRMKPLGFTIEQMRDLLVVVLGLRAHPDGAERTRLLAELATFITVASERREKLQRQLAMADEFIATLHEHERAGVLGEVPDGDHTTPRVRHD